MNLELNGEERPDHLLQEYGRVRRLRDYLKDLLRTQSQPTIALDDDDSNLLASCCVFAIQSILMFMANTEVGSDSEKWIEENKRNLFLVAKTFATQPIESIEGRGGIDAKPHPELTRMISEINRNVTTLSGDLGGSIIVKGDEFMASSPAAARLSGSTRSRSRSVSTASSSRS